MSAMLLESLRARYGRGIALVPVAGGDCHTAYQLTTEEGQKYFVKSNTGVHCKVLASERLSLLGMAELLGDAASIYPQIEAYIEHESLCYLVLQWRELEGLTESHGVCLANSLFSQHSIAASRFGWAQPNYIGLSTQNNEWDGCWADFFLQQRLLVQIEMAKTNGLPPPLLERLKRASDRAYDLLKHHHPVPALLHGDLWVGNVAWDAHNEQPCLYDPAPYFGDWEVDIAMSRLFGQLPDSFYRHYFDLSSSHPMGVDGLEERARIYNLYHALNHVNLFGQTYLSLLEGHL